jgi:hypothetical protein
MIIDCGTCAVAGLACGDCVVSVLLGAPEAIDLSDRPVGDIPVISVLPRTHVDDEHAAALEVLADSGLVPPLRLVPRSQAS